MPSPSGFNNGLRIFVPGFPTEAFLCFCGICDEFGGVSGAARSGGRGDGVLCDTAGGFQNFFDGETASRSKVDSACEIGKEGSEMGVREIGHMDIVADAGSVRGRIIIAKDLEFFLLSESDLQDIGDDMGFNGMIFPEISLGTAGVEVAEENGAEGNKS